MSDHECFEEPVVEEEEVVEPKNVRFATPEDDEYMAMDEFVKTGKEMVDYVADHIENSQDRKLMPKWKRGKLAEMLPNEAPKQREEWEAIMNDVEGVIEKGLVNVQHPNYHGFYPSGNSYPAILGEMLASAYGTIGFSWASCPAQTELETIVMDWLGKMINLPPDFLHENDVGGGCIANSPESSFTISLLAARWAMFEHQKHTSKCYAKGIVHSKLVAYCSTMAHSFVAKGTRLAYVKLREIEPDLGYCMRGVDLQKAIDEDRRKGFIPFYVFVSIGTSTVNSYDNLKEIGPIAEKEKMWVHVDASYAGNALICPEYQHLIEGIEYADSFSFDPPRMMLVTHDCTAFFVKNRELLEMSWSVDPVYLKHSHYTVDFRHWCLALSRRFRALKLWFVIRSYGVSGLQAHVRRIAALAKKFERLVRNDRRFEIKGWPNLGICCFRLKHENVRTQLLLRAINMCEKLHMFPALLNDEYTIRFSISSPKVSERDIIYAWNIISQLTWGILALFEQKKELFKEYEEFNYGDEIEETIEEEEEDEYSTCDQAVQTTGVIMIDEEGKFIPLQGTGSATSSDVGSIVGGEPVRLEIGNQVFLMHPDGSISPIPAEELEGVLSGGRETPLGLFVREDGEHVPIQCEEGAPLTCVAEDKDGNAVLLGKGEDGEPVPLLIGEGGAPVAVESSGDDTGGKSRSRASSAAGSRAMSTAKSGSVPPESTDMSLGMEKSDISTGKSVDETSKSKCKFPSPFAACRGTRQDQRQRMSSSYGAMQNSATTADTFQESSRNRKSTLEVPPEDKSLLARYSPMESQVTAMPTQSELEGQSSNTISGPERSGMSRPSSAQPGDSRQSQLKGQSSRAISGPEKSGMSRPSSAQPGDSLRISPVTEKSSRSRSNKNVSGIKSQVSSIPTVSLMKSDINCESSRSTNVPCKPESSQFVTGQQRDQSPKSVVKTYLTLLARKNYRMGSHDSIIIPVRESNCKGTQTGDPNAPPSNLSVTKGGSRKGSRASRGGSMNEDTSKTTQTVPVKIPHVPSILIRQSEGLLQSGNSFSHSVNNNPPTEVVSSPAATKGLHKVTGPKTAKSTNAGLGLPLVGRGQGSPRGSITEVSNKSSQREGTVTVSQISSQKAATVTASAKSSNQKGPASAKSSQIGTSTVVSAKSSQKGTSAATSARNSQLGTSTVVSAKSSQKGTSAATSAKSSQLGTSTVVSAKSSQKGTSAAASAKSSQLGTSTAVSTKSSLKGTSPAASAQSSQVGTSTAVSQKSSQKGTSAATSSCFGKSPSPSAKSSKKEAASATSQRSVSKSPSPSKTSSSKRKAPEIVITEAKSKESNF